MIAVAIDGPAGAGKSSISRKVAQKLNFLYVDTGAMYRAVALYMVRKRVNLQDDKALARHLGQVDIALTYENGVQHILLNGRDVSEDIRENKISEYASLVSKHPSVRSFLLKLQRDIARRHNIIMDGRDIGTVVLPRAQVKIFLTASVEKRAHRRHWQLKKKGQHVPMGQLIEEISQRDLQDTTRAHAPLKQAKDAILIDNSDMGVSQSVKKIIEIIEERTK